MDLQKYTWLEAPRPSPQVVDRLSSELGIPAAGARVLAARRFGDRAAAADYLFPGPALCPDPFDFEFMEEAVAGVRHAAAAGSKVLIHGDYDVDGIAGTTLLYLYLQLLFPRVYRFLPDRRRDGYGMSARAVRWAREEGVGLVIAVDCGTSDRSLIEELEASGTKVIVCDHHEFPSGGSWAGIMLNPVRPGERYPNKELAGAAVAFKLVQALVRAGLKGGVDPDELLDLVALATIGDLVPLVGENRYFVRRGLERINGKPRAGIRALIAASGLEAGRIGAGQVSFVLAPRLNAPGRIGRARPALELLCTDQLGPAEELALRLEEENSKRRQLTEKVEREAEEMARQQGGAAVGGFVLGSASWDEGVLGIAASRLVDRYGRPAVLVSTGGLLAKGSGRSVPGVNLKELLDRCSGYLLRYGGHAQAVGLTMEPELFPRFQQELTRIMEEAAVGLPSRPSLPIDGDIGLEECTMEMVDFLSLCEPFGYGNRAPIWKMAGVTVGTGTRVVGNGHLKLHFRDGGGRTGEAMFFGAGNLGPDTLREARLDLAVCLRKGLYAGRFYPELQVKDMRPIPSPALDVGMGRSEQGGGR